MKTSVSGRSLYNFLNRKWFFDKVYNACIAQLLLKFGYNTTYKIIDRGIFEVFGPAGISIVVPLKSLYLTKLQTNYIYHYTFIILIGVTFLVGARQFWLVFGEFVDFRLFPLFFVLIFYLLSVDFGKK
jgi:NADH:ubiquinone oxidoreductase subunit 5 (subunit L)/multisubunit Na+/H+ antiporter MnhA subunit